MQKTAENFFRSSRNDILIWSVLSIPWVWTVYFQPVFWDDWHNISNNSIYELSKHFLFGGGKSFLSPLLFLSFNLIGPWFPHMVCFISMVLVSRLVGEICSQSPLNLNRKYTTWITYTLPIFHARYSISVIEYAICFLFLLLAWKYYLIKKANRWRILVGTFLFIALSMPSTAILIPLLVANRVVRVYGRFHLGRFLKTIAFSPEIYTPIVVYAVIFKVLLNSTDKYKVSIGATVAWVKLLIFVSLILVFFSYFHKKLGGSNKIRNLIIYALGLIQIGLLPYFAIGYNPLRSFLPHLWRFEYIQDNQIKFAMCFTFLFLSGVIAQLWYKNCQLSHALFIGIGVTSLLAAMFAVVGPLDWDSRLWILTIPGFAILFYALNLTGTTKAPIGLIVILFIANTLISYEYFLDLQKQTAFENAVALNQDSSSRIELGDKNELIIYVDRTQFSKIYTARDRTYRQYEFSGPISRATGIPYSRLSIQFDNSELPFVQYCSSKPEVNILIPIIESESLRSIFDLKLPKIQLRYFTGIDPRCVS